MSIVTRNGSLSKGDTSNELTDPAVESTFTPPHIAKESGPATADERTPASYYRAFRISAAESRSLRQ